MKKERSLPATATVTDKRGLKRICMSCGTRFYDFNKRPVICPNCTAEFSGEIKVKGRRSRIAAVDDAEVIGEAVPSKVAATVEDEDIAASEDVVSLDEVEEMEEGAAEEPDIDIEGDLEEIDEVEDDLDDELEEEEIGVEIDDDLKG